MSSIESVKEALEAAYKEIDDLLEAAEKDPQLLSDDTHDDLCEVQEVIGGFLYGEEGPVEDEPA